jgi:EAL domain-containing protein (putative c-di-GMP-specific phosphodiesterase class I)
MDQHGCRLYIHAVTLLPSPSSTLTELLAEPAMVRSINRPVVSLTDGRCVGYQASVRVAEWAGRSPAPWFRAASDTGLSGRLGALTLQAALRERATLPGERFLAVELDQVALSHPEVVGVLAAEDDVSDLMITLVMADPPCGPSIGPVLEGLRGRGMRLAVPVGMAGLADLLALERLSPDLILLPAELVRGIHLEPIQQRLIDVVVELADGLGAATLAEEVESLDEAQALRSGGVRTATGWLFGRARPGYVPPSAEVCEWLRRPQAPP